MMSETQEIVDLFQNKYKILSDSLNDLNAKIIKNSEKLVSLNNEQKENKFVEYIRNYIQFFSETFSKFEKEFQLPFYDLCSELFRDSIQTRNFCLKQTTKEEPVTVSEQLTKKETKSRETSAVRAKIVNKVEDSISISSISEANNDTSVFCSLKEESDNFQFLSLECYTDYKMKVSYMKSPLLFYLHLETSDTILRHLNKTLHEKYGSLDDNQMTIQKPRVNSIVAAQYSKDSFWYRAKIISINKTDQTAFVYYVDYGNSETLPFKKLRKLEEKHLVQPGQAVPCSLIYAMPTNGNEWPVETSKRLQALILSAKLSVKIFYEKEWPIYFCSIKIIEAKSDKDVLDILINEKLAVMENNTLKQISMLLPTLNLEKYLPEIKSSEVKPTVAKDINNNNIIKFNKDFNINNKKNSTASTTNLAVKTNNNNLVNDRLGNSVQNLASDSANPKPSTAAAATTCEKVIPPRCIELSQDDALMFDCEVVNVIHPNEFYIRPLDESDDEYINLEKEMLKFYQSNFIFKNKHHFMNDKVSAVLFDSAYYRATRVDTGDKNEHLMYFIDLGFFEKVKSYNIYPLDDQFYKLPAKVIKCSLHGIRSSRKDKKWSLDSIDWFKKEIKKYDCFLAGAYEDKTTLEIPYDKTFDMILTIMQDDLLYTFNDELVRIGYAEMISSSSDVLNVEDLNVKYADQDESFKKKRVEEYVASCVANTLGEQKSESENVKKENDKVQMDKQKSVTDLTKNSGNKSIISQQTCSAVKSTISQKPPSMTPDKSIVSQKPPSVPESTQKEVKTSVLINSENYDIAAEQKKTNYATNYRSPNNSNNNNNYDSYRSNSNNYNNGYNRYNSTSKVNSVKNDELSNWNPMKEDYNSARNIYNYDDENVDNVMYGYNRNQHDICRDYQRGTCRRVSCPYIHVKNEKGRETAKI